MDLLPPPQQSGLAAYVEKARQAKAVCVERIKAANQKLAELLGTSG
ncbi:hypothetical protein G4177_31650 [Corallococcus sp. ZKHCc1 1396]|uniref:Uncharacterized protein n=1 Tax=Corallococcus soli TaxID=2710757 RepID=A0ABR9PXQ8_9BACT|nr:hypothetical protein [Corallococcus soli]MBE4752721.1 hypothetical protein [Corallococcus soli]